MAGLTKLGVPGVGGAPAAVTVRLADWLALARKAVMVTRVLDETEKVVTEKVAEV